MFMNWIFKKINWDKLLIVLPWLFSYIIFMTEEDNITRSLIALVCSIMFTVYVIVQNKSNVHNIEWRKYTFAPFCVVMALLVFCSLYNPFYFFVGVITITLFIYKIFEFLGDKLELFLYDKYKMPLVLTLLIKLLIWFAGLFVFVVSFFVFVIWYVNLYPKDAISLMFVKLQSSLITVIGISTFSLLIAVFIIDFLIKMVFIDLKLINAEMIGRFGIQQLFIKIIFVIIFADLSYSLIYLTFSGIKIEKFESIDDFLLMWLDYLRSFYYAFCLHFAIPMPTDPFYTNLDKIVRQTPPMYIIQFFHFCINKIIDITMLAYMAGIILSILGLKNEKNDDK
ncbi:hypothetical protein BK143_01225 [Paenibacillus peoriae]|nr:hypothetical protein BK143_01225 [Paenibacillus peoriae]